MYVTKEELVNDKEFKIILGLIIALVIILIIGLIYIFIIRRRRNMKKSNQYERASKRGSVAITPNNRKSLMLLNAQMAQMGKLSRVSMLKDEEQSLRESINPEGALPKDIQVPPKRYTPFTFDLTRLSVLDVKGRESNKF